MKVVLKPKRLRVQLVTMENHMSSSIDFGTLCVGALVGMGCRKQLKSAARVAAVTAANLAGVAATAAAQVAAETSKSAQQGQQVGSQNPNG